MAAFFEANYWVEMVKFTVMRASVSTASPDCRYGLKRHCFTASRAAVERMVGPLRDVQVLNIAVASDESFQHDRALYLDLLGQHRVIRFDWARQ